MLSCVSRSPGLFFQVWSNKEAAIRTLVCLRGNIADIDQGRVFSGTNMALVYLQGLQALQGTGFRTAAAAFHPIVHRLSLADTRDSRLCQQSAVIMSVLWLRRCRCWNPSSSNFQN